MHLRLKRMIAALVGAVLLAGGALYASPASPSRGSTVDSSARVSVLLAEIQKETPGLTLNADTLRTFVSSRHQWQTHATYLDAVKGHINSIGEHVAELQQLRDAALPWQQQAISEVTSHAVQVAGRTQAAIVYLKENPGRLFLPEYTDHLNAIADASANLGQTVDRFIDYQKTQQKLERLQAELELSGD